MADSDPVMPEDLDRPAPKLAAHSGPRKVGIKVRMDEPAPDVDVEPSMDKLAVVHAKSEEEEDQVEIPTKPTRAQKEEVTEELQTPPAAEDPKVAAARKQLENAAAWANDVNGLMGKSLKFRKAFAEALQEEGRQVDPRLLESIRVDEAKAPPPPAKRMTEEEAEMECLRLLSERKFFAAARLAAKYDLEPQIQTLEQKTAAQVAASEKAAQAEVDTRERAFVRESFKALSKTETFKDYITVEANGQFTLDPTFDKALMDYCRAYNVKITPDINFEKLCNHALLEMGVTGEQPAARPALDPNRPRPTANQRQQFQQSQTRKASAARNGKYVVNIGNPTADYRGG